MSQITRNLVEKRLRQKDGAKFKGRYVKHSDIIRRQGGASGEISPILVSGKTTPCDGGTHIILADNPAYCVSTFFMPREASTGRKKIKTGSKTLILIKGVAHIELGGKGFDKREMLRGGERLNIRKGNSYAISSGNFPLEFIVIDSKDLTEKVETASIVGTDGATTYVANRRTEGEAPVERPLRKRKTKEEREALGKQYQQAMGVIPQNVRHEQYQSNPPNPNTDAAMAIMGANPTPLGAEAAALIGE